MANKLLHKFCIILSILFCICSCGLEEPINVQNENNSVNIIFRPASYKKANVGTKTEATQSTVFDVEDIIYSAYLLVFDDNGDRILMESLTIGDDNKSVLSKTISADRSISNSTLCVIANVPLSFVNQWSQVASGESYSSDLSKFQNAEIDFSASGSPFSFASPFIGIPQIIIDNQNRQCFPMYGCKENCNLSAGGDVTIDIKRLFARIDLTLSLNITEDDSMLTSKPKFTLQGCDIFNIPKKVSLTTSDVTSCAYLPDANALLMTASLSSFNLSNATAETMTDNILSNGTGGKSLYFYVPEHKLGITHDNENQGSKPDIVSGTSYRALYASITGVLVDGEGVSHNAQYDIFFGINSTNDFDICRNTRYNNYVNINGTSEKDTDHRVSLEEIDGYVESLVSNGKTANCYIIGQTGTYLLPAYRGAFNSMVNAVICDEGTDEVIVCDNPNIRIEILHDLCKQSTIALKISHSASFQNVVMTGNAVIARRKKSGELDWSWHLWFVPGVTIDTEDAGLSMGEYTVGGIGNNTMGNGTMMNRNLGVYTRSSDITSWIPGGDVGVYYKYGRKEPFFGGTNMAGEEVCKKYQGDEASVYAVWSSDDKAVTDPCPIGYRVPSKSVWTGVSNKNHFHDKVTGSLIYDYTKVGDFSYYPFAGYVGSDNEVHGDVSDKGEDQDPLSDVLIPSNQNNTVLNRVTSKPNYDPITCTSITYRSMDLEKGGYLLTDSMVNTENNDSANLLYYYYTADGIQILECTYYQGSWKQEGWLSKYYVASYTNDQKNNTITKTGEQIENENPDLFEAIKQGVKNEIGNWWDGIVDFFEVTAESKWIEVKSDYGYQVRCVQEEVEEENE